MTEFNRSNSSQKSLNEIALHNNFTVIESENKILIIVKRLLLKLNSESKQLDVGQIILNWGFPFYLIVLEMLYRGVSGQNISSFVGPTIATTGLSFLLPLTQPKKCEESLHSTTVEVVEKNGGIVVNRQDQRLLPFIWLSIFIGLLIWFWASHTASTAEEETIWFIPKHIGIGFVNYILAAILSAIKGGL